MSLSLKPLAIGSLPHKSSKEALDYVFELFKSTPFWPQLGNIDKKEDMIVQYTQNIPGIIYDKKNDKYVLEMESEEFFEAVENFYSDYELITSGEDVSLLDKYAITAPFSCAFDDFLKRIEKAKPEFIKGHVTGPFTFGVAICDSEGRCGFFDDTARDIMTKGLILKALWEIREFKKHSPKSEIVIFVDEPAVCQYGTSAFVTVQKSQIEEVFEQTIEAIQTAGAFAGIHCCGKADWEMMIDTGFNLLNLDAYLYAQNLSLYPKKVDNFLKKGGYIAWGVVPTLDKDELEKMDIEKAVEIFENAVSVLTAKGIDKDLIIKQSVVTPSCGAGGLEIELAQKAMKLTVDLSDALKKKYL